MFFKTKIIISHIGKNMIYYDAF